MVVVKHGYPFSFYECKRTGLPKEQAVLLNDVLAVMDRRATCGAFAKKYGVDVGHLEEFVESLDVTSFHKPLSKRDGKRVLDSLKAVLRRVDPGGGVAAEAVSSVFSYFKIQPFLDDDDLEEVMVNGANAPVLVYHRTAGLCKTSVELDPEGLKGLVLQLGSSMSTAFDDLSLADGSRANVTLPPLVSSPCITVRKFKHEPFTVIDLIRSKTVSVEVAAFLWTAFDGMGVFPLNLLIAGSTAAGKTTTLNALACFVPPHERIVSIEDVPELSLNGKQNWVPLFSGRKADAQDLLKNALRMRPDRLIVGDIRGREAETLFTAMNTGHRGTSGTMHANNDRDALTRLENEPMNVPRDLLPLADLIVVQHRFIDRRLGWVRRVLQVSEVSRLEDVVALNQLYKWDAVSDSIVRTESPSYALEKLAKGTCHSISEVMEEVEKRRQLLEYLDKKGLSKQDEITSFMAQYYEKTLGEVRNA